MPWHRDRRPRQARGYDADHDRERRRLLPLAWGQPCPECGWPMLEEQRLELDHLVPLALGGRGGPTRIIHARCNRRRGARLGAAIAAGRRWQTKQRSRW